MFKGYLPEAVFFDDVFSLTPRAVAGRSLYVKKAYACMLDAAGGMKDGELKKKITDMLLNPVPEFMRLYDRPGAREKLCDKLARRGFLNGCATPDELLPDISLYRENPPPVWVAPGSNYYGHHSHPGGLALHTEGNLRICLGVALSYQKMYGTEYDADIMVFAQIAHDLAKTWVLQWLEDASCLRQYNIADTGAHHIYGLAESLWRGVPPEAAFAQAATHVKPDSKKGRGAIAGFLRAAALIADIDPVGYGLLDKYGDIALDTGRMEYWFCYLGDHSVVFNVPVTRRVIEFLQRLAVEEYGFSDEDMAGKKFNQLRNFILCACTAPRIYQLLLTGGDRLAAGEIKKLFK